MFFMIIIASVISCTFANECYYEGCSFNGKNYTEGEVISSVCFTVQCVRGAWVFSNINYKCALCHITDDPHITTFDSYYYDWHGRCNYTISQPINCKNFNSTYNPSYGIFGDFSQCWYDDTVSCVDVTTYKVNPSTIVTITHANIPNTIVINDVSITVPPTPKVPTNCLGFIFPVIIWKVGNCVRIVGNDYSIEACPTYMYIYTTDDHLKVIGGLCGFYTGNIGDDFLKRDYSPETLGNVFPFAVSWKTHEFKEDCKIYGDYPKDPVKCDGEEEIRNKCASIVKEAINSCGDSRNKDDFKNAIESCVTDCCAEQKYCDFWMKNIYNFVCGLGTNAKQQRGE